MRRPSAASLRQGTQGGDGAADVDRAQLEKLFLSLA
jgi:hypothetical protein